MPQGRRALLSHLVRRLLLLIAALPVAVVAVGGGNAQGGDNGSDTLIVSTEDLNDVTVPRFAFEVNGEPCLSDTVVEVPGAGQVDLDLTDPNHGTFTLPQASFGEYEVVVTCTTDSGTEHGTGFIDFGFVLIEKVVTGDVPETAQFVIDVACDSDIFTSPAAEAYGGESGEGFGPDAIQATLTYGPSGGTDVLVHYRGQTCTIEETETGGAQTVTVETEDCGAVIPVSPPGEATTGSFEINEPVSCLQTVTNDFAPAVVDPDDEEPDVVAATPPFTG